MMKMLTTTAIALAAVALAGPAAAQNYGAAAAPQQSAASPAPAAAAKGQIKLSKKASKAIIDLQTAVKANDVANIAARAREAEAVAETAEDRYAIGKLELDAARAAKDNEAAARAVEYIASSNYLPKASVASLYNSLGVDFFNAKNPARATAMFQKSLAVDPNNAEGLRLLAEVQNASGNPADAVANFQRAMQQSLASGQKLPEDSFKRAVQAAYNAKLPSAVDISRQWAEAYPSAESWRNAIAIYRNMRHPNVQGSLDLLRLMRAAGALTTNGDYTLLATTSAEQGNYGEALAVMEEGLANNRVTRSDPVARDTLAGLKTKPKPSAADLETAAKSAPNGTSLIRVGDRFYGIGNYSRAADLYRQAIAKGGDASLANLHLGMALARAGDKAGATAALNAVTGADADIAKYWLAYINRGA